MPYSSALMKSSSIMPSSPAARSATWRSKRPLLVDRNSFSSENALQLAAVNEALEALGQTRIGRLALCQRGEISTG